MAIIDPNTKTWEGDRIATEKDVGNISDLETDEKSTIVGAMNELFTNVSDGKEQIGTAITDVDEDVDVPENATFDELSNAIGEIETGDYSVGDVIALHDIDIPPDMAWERENKSKQKISTYDGELVYTDTSNEITALDKEGEELWTNSNPTGTFRSFISDSDNNVYFLNVNRSGKLDKDGEEIWFERIDKYFKKFVVNNEDKLFGLKTSTLVRLSEEGEELEEYDIEHASTSPLISVDDSGNFYIREGVNNFSKYDSSINKLWTSENLKNEMYAIEACNNGVFIASYKTLIKFNSEGEKEWDTSIPNDKRINIIHADKEGNVYVVNTDDNVFYKYSKSGDMLPTKNDDSLGYKYAITDIKGNLYTTHFSNDSKVRGFLTKYNQYREILN